MLMTPGCPEGNWYSEGNNTESVCISEGSQLFYGIKSHVTTPQGQVECTQSKQTVNEKNAVAFNIHTICIRTNSLVVNQKLRLTLVFWWCHDLSWYHHSH